MSIRESGRGGVEKLEGELEQARGVGSQDLLLFLVGEAGGPHIVEGADVLLLLEIREIGTTHQLRDAEGLRGQGQRRLVEVGGVEKELPQGLVRRGREGVPVLVVILDALRQHGEIAAQVRDVERDAWETARYIGLQELKRRGRILDRRTVDPLQLVAEQPRRINTAASRVNIDHHGAFIEEAPDRVEGGIRQIGLLRQQRGQAGATELTGVFDPLQLLQRRVDVFAYFMPYRRLWPESSRRESVELFWM